MYEESAAIPLIVGPAADAELSLPKTCATTTTLLDISETILDHFDADLPGDRPGRSLYGIASQSGDPDRAVFSEYHAVGAVSGAFMLRKGCWKLIEYVGFDPELFNLETDAGEVMDLAQDPDCAGVLAEMKQEMRKICDPEAINNAAFADQEAMIEA